MKNAKKYLLLSMFLTPEIAMAADKCEHEWNQLFQRSETMSYQQVLAVWEKNEAVCKGAWFFDYQKARLLIQIGELDKAKNVIVSAEKKYQDVSPFNLLSIEIERMDLAANGDFSEESYNNLNKKLTALDGKLISNYADFKSELSVVKLTLGETDAAIKYANEGLEIQEDGQLLKTLALAYEVKGDYPSVKKALNRLAVVAADTLSKDKGLLLLSARTFAAEGRMDLSKGMIIQASELSEKDLQDPEILRTVQYIKDKMASGEFSNKPAP